MKSRHTSKYFQATLFLIQLNLNKKLNQLLHQANLVKVKITNKQTFPFPKFQAFSHRDIILYVLIH